jgi:hypothetical protein
MQRAVRTPPRPLTLVAFCRGQPSHDRVIDRRGSARRLDVARAATASADGRVSWVAARSDQLNVNKVLMSLPAGLWRPMYLNNRRLATGQPDPSNGDRR